MRVMKKDKKLGNRKKHNALAIVIIAIIVIGIALSMAGSFYLWSRGCQGTITAGPKSSIFTGCNEKQGNTQEDTKKDVRQLIWDKLPAEQKARINGNWQDSKVSKTTLKEGMMSANGDTSYIGKEVYIVDFLADDTNTSINVIVFADLNTFTFIGNGLID